jgi:glycosyltransferase involved in cell wall biosynthesis
MSTRSEPPVRRVTVVSHAVIINGLDNFGPAHNVVDFLVASGTEVDFVLHPLGSSGSGIQRAFRQGRLVANQVDRYTQAARVRETLRNARLGASDESDVLVLVDPLNFATAGFVHQLRRRRRGLVVYYTADYADRRFESSLLNRVYHGLDGAAVRAADVVWNVSRRIRDKRREQGVPDADNFHISNAPAFDRSSIVPFETRPADSLVMVGSLDRILEHRMLVDCLELLRRRRPQLRASIIGTGNGEGQFRAELRRRGLTENVNLTGFIPRPEALSIVRSSRVGLAFYSGNASWTEYCDSVKVREYLSLGLPVVTTGNHPLAAEVASSGAGVIVKNGAHAADAIDSLFDRDGKRVSESAMEMGRAYDRDTVLTAAMTDLSRRLAERGTRQARR